MIEYVPVEFLTFTVGTATVFGGLLWRDLNNKVKDLQDEQDNCPFPNINRDIAEIKNDLKWIKNIIGKDI